LAISLGELIHLGQPVMRAGDTIDRFINTTFAVPTRTDLYKHAARDGLQRLAAARWKDLCAPLRFRSGFIGHVVRLQLVDARAARS
jgi:hypothetical protein